MVIPGVTTRQSRVHKKPVALTLLLMKEILHQFVVYPNLTRCLYILGGLQDFSSVNSENASGLASCTWLALSRMRRAQQPHVSDLSIANIHL